MYKVEDLIEGTVVIMNEVNIINKAQELYEEVEDGCTEDDIEVMPVTLKQSVECLYVYGFTITKV